MCRLFEDNEPKDPCLLYITKNSQESEPPSPPGRSILSTNDAPTHRISEFVEHFLQPYLV